MVQPLSIGNAVRLLLEPPAGAVRWKVLRKGSDSFTGHDDDESFLAYDGNDKAIVDCDFLLNDVPSFWRPFYTADGGATWEAGPTATGTPRASYDELTTDVFSLVRDRLEAGLRVEVERQVIAAELGFVQVFPSPPGVHDDLRFPLVTMHLESEARAESAIGEYIGGDEFDAAAFDWGDQEGWLASVHLQIATWSTNADERVELRKALRRIVVGNLSVFDAAGITQVGFEMSDVDYLNGEFGAPVYQTMANFSCQAPVRVGGRITAVRDISARSING